MGRLAAPFRISNTAVPNTAVPNTAVPNTAVPITAVSITAVPITAVSIAAVSITTASIAALHLTVAGVDPVRQPLSDYATVPAGYLLVWIASIAMAAAAITLGAAIGRAGLPRAWPVQLLLGTWSAALVVVAAFPTNAPGAVPDAAAAIHRAAAAWVVAALPLIGWHTARRARAARCWTRSAPGILGWTAGVTVLGAAFLAAHLPLLAGGSPVAVLGVLERCLYVAAAGLLLVLGRAVRHACDPDATATGENPVIALGQPA